MKALEQLVTTLRDPAVLGHAIDDFELLETHLSYVLLVGRFAYKLKKPVDLGFVDFSTLEKRKMFCDEELRLNRRLAPDLYLKVIAIGGTVEHPEIDGPDPAIEFAVKMRRFDGATRLDCLQESGRLSKAHIDDLCEQVGVFHDGAEVAPAISEFGTPDCIAGPVRENFRQLDENCAEAAAVELNERLRCVAEQEWARLADVFVERKREGWVRECHGDMHLANIALVDDRVLIFDCLEFSPKLRWIDVMSEVAFVLMDLDFRGCGGFANRFLDRYLQHTGDYTGLRVLRFYRMYRAMVRAKVAAIRALQEPEGSASRTQADREDIEHLWLAERYAESGKRPVVIVLHGLSGSGKSTMAERLLDHLDAVRIRSDVERKRLAGLTAEARSDSGVDQGLYGPDMTRRTYDRLQELARTIVSCGYSVIVDATFLKRAERATFRELAEESGTPFVIVEVSAARATLERRVAAREIEGSDASEANLGVLAKQLETVEPLSTGEREFAVEVSTDEKIDYAELASRIIAN
jgi:aminoglycoside phosphotransferase family enzyme/predicted kinase